MQQRFPAFLSFPANTKNLDERGHINHSLKMKKRNRLSYPASFIHSTRKVLSSSLPAQPWAPSSQRVQMTQASIYESQTQRMQKCQLSYTVTSLMTTTPQFRIKLEIQWIQIIVGQIFFFYLMLWKIKFQHSLFAVPFISFLWRLVWTGLPKLQQEFFATPNSPFLMQQPLAGRALRLTGIFVVQGQNVKPLLFINTFQHKRTTMMQSCICNFLSSKFFHIYIYFCKFAVSYGPCRCVQLCKILRLCTARCS